MKLTRYLILIFLILNSLMIHIANGNEGDILIDIAEKELESGKQWALSEGYALNITIINRYVVHVLLSKNGVLVHEKSVDIMRGPYPYRGINNNNNKNDKLILTFNVQNIESNKIQIKSIVQYSDGSFFPTPTATQTKVDESIILFKIKSLMKNESLTIVDGWTLKVQNIDSKEKKVILGIYKNEIELDKSLLNEGFVYNYNNIFSATIEDIFIQADTDFVRLSDIKFDPRYIQPLPKPTPTPAPVNFFEYIIDLIQTNFVPILLLIVLISIAFFWVRNRNPEDNPPPNAVRIPITYRIPNIVRESNFSPITTIEDINEEARCPICQSYIKNTFNEYGGIIRCNKCKVCYHKDCYGELNNKCASDLCKQNN